MAEISKILYVHENRLDGPFGDRLIHAGHSLHLTPDGYEGMKRLVFGDYDLLITGMYIPFRAGEKTSHRKFFQGLTVLDTAKIYCPKIPIIIVSSIFSFEMPSNFQKVYGEIPYITSENEASFIDEVNEALVGQSSKN